MADTISEYALITPHATLTLDETLASHTRVALTVEDEYDVGVVDLDADECRALACALLSRADRIDPPPPPPPLPPLTAWGFWATGDPLPLEVDGG